jgi:ParB-like chromosome segregation protein Spo0J
MNPRDINTRPPFSTLFPVQQKTVNAITESMIKRGYDRSQPLHVWRQGNCLIDGHQRLQAAIAAGLDDVHVFFHDVEDEDTALDYAIANQRDRRNLSDAEIMAAVAAVDDIKKKGGDRKSNSARSKVPHGTIDPGGRSATETAAKVGTTKKKVDNARAALADPEEKAAVLSGEKSLNQAATDARAKKSKGKTATGSRREKTKIQQYRETHPRKEDDEEDDEEGDDEETLWWKRHEELTRKGGSETSDAYSWATEQERLDHWKYVVDELRETDPDGDRVRQQLAEILQEEMDDASPRGQGFGFTWDLIVENILDQVKWDLVASALLEELDSTLLDPKDTTS